MKNCRLLFLLLVMGIAMNTYAQTETDTVKNNKNDSIRNHSFTMNVDLLSIISQKQTDRHADLKFVNGAQFNYRIKNSESQLFFRQIINRLESGFLYTNHYVNLSFDSHRYQNPDQKRKYLRIFYPQPTFIFQNNVGRGLQKRFQAGLFLYPVRYFQPQLKINVGIGCFYDWSSWEVNNMDRINMLPTELKQKIVFINSHSKLRENMYMDNSEFKPTCFLSFNYITKSNLSLGCIFSYQQSVVSPFKEEITSVYPELKKVYPCIYSQIYAAMKIYKGLSFKTSFIYDYENNKLSFYNSAWEYNFLFGLSWVFPG